MPFTYAVVGGSPVVPRDVFHALLAPRTGAGPEPVRDGCVMRVKASGETGGRRAEAVVELVVGEGRARGWDIRARVA